MTPRIEQREATTIIGIAIVGNPHTTDFHDFWMNQFMPREPEIKPLSRDGAYYEAFFCAGEPEQVEIVAGMAVAPDATPPEGLVKRELAATTYAVFDCTVGTIGATWTAIEQWLSEAEWEYDREHQGDFELYPPDTKDQDSPVAIYVPVKAS
ncbi:MAG: GyrI-like domain-containing protein [Armatimonadetes bacterium]|nr:GyrI-like domain-containing protein [Armatimonadota bacterium]